MIEKPKRQKQLNNQDRQLPSNIQELINRYDLDNTKIYEFLDDVVEYFSPIDIEGNNVAIGKKYDTSDGSKLQVDGDVKANKFNGNLNGTSERANKDSDGYFINTYYLKNFRREMAQTNTNLDDPGINGLFEVRTTELNYTGTKPFVGFYPFLNLKTPDNIAMFQLAGLGGNFYYRAKQSANVAMSGVSWTKFRDSSNWGVSLYDNASGTTGTVTLSETSANFSYIEIFYKNNIKDTAYQSEKIYNPNGKNITVSNVSTASDSVAQVSWTSWNISGTTMKNLGENYFNVKTSGASISWSAASSSHNYIVKVVGYR